jgi:hypothetical protein
MGTPKMVILPGNQTGPKQTDYPDEQGNYPPWPEGALHKKAAEAYAKSLNYEPIVLKVGGYPQNQQSPQAKASLDLFRGDPDVCAFYGFSGGGYNVRHILEYLATNEPLSLHRIDRIVVIGAPFKTLAIGKSMFQPARYIAEFVGKKAQADPAWQKPNWVLTFRENPDRSQMPKGTEKLPTHMFGPDVLLAGWPE